MYSVYLCKKLKNNFYNLKNDKNLLNHYIEKYNLKDEGIEKKYYKNNILIETLNDNLYFFKITDKNIFYEKNYLFTEYQKDIISSFHFTNVDYEEEYKVYKNTINNVSVISKIFDNYFELEFISDDLNSIKKIIIL